MEQENKKIDKITTMRLRNSTKKRLDEYRFKGESYEKAVIKLLVVYEDLNNKPIEESQNAINVITEQVKHNPRRQVAQIAKKFEVVS